MRRCWWWTTRRRSAFSSRPCFSDEGALIFEAADGVRALEVAAQKQPDLITLHLSMPGKDGIDTFFDLRNAPATEEIPVCIITGYPECRKLISDRPVAPPEGFVYKPCDPDHVVKNARRILGLRKRKRSRRAEK